MPYIIASTLTVMMNYILMFIAYNKGLDSMPGAESVKGTMNFGVLVVIPFSVVFLFYTNSFLIKRRSKEIGLYNILGMGKRHIAKMLFFETIYTALISIVGGIALGILFSKLSVLLLYKIMDFPAPFGLELSNQGIRNIVVMFGTAHILILIKNLIKVSVSKPVELLQGGNAGEKEPKTKWIMTILGVICIGIGYYMAVTIEDPMSALSMFFVAVILVIIGTHLLFTAGSIAVLKLLKSNKRYYYKASHFTSISGMLYRMKQNAVGLANICILSTMVIVVFSTTVSLYSGLENILNEKFSRDMVITGVDLNKASVDRIKDEAKKTMDSYGYDMKDLFEYESVDMNTIKTGNILGDSEVQDNDTAERILVKAITLDDYNRLSGEKVVLNDDEILIHGVKKELTGSIKIGDKEYKIIKNFGKIGVEEELYIRLIDTYVIVFKDEATVKQVYDVIYMDRSSWNGMNYTCAFDTNAPKDKQVNITNKLKDVMVGIRNDIEVNGIELDRADFLKVFGGLLFLGISLGILFIMATVLIIYYKQISEGYDDRERFIIMQKVGMTKKEVKSTIRFQVLLVFFLPLIVASIHTAFAFNMIFKIVQLFGMQNSTLFAYVTAVTILVFAILYGIVYAITAKTYYRIVE